MSRLNLILAALLAVAIVILLAIVLTQHQALQDLRASNLAQRQQLEQATLEAQDLSNRVSRAAPAQTSPQDPSPELLRLRGEVSLLRNQLQQLQQLSKAQQPAPPAPPQDSAPPPESPSERWAKIQALRISAQAQYLSLKTISDKLQAQAQAADYAGMVQTIQATDKRDDILDSLLKRRQLATQPSDQAALDQQIKQRCDGIAFGFQARAESVKMMLDELQANPANPEMATKLEDFLRAAEKKAEQSP